MIGVATLIIGVADADSSKIKGMTKYINPNDQDQVSFIVETDSGTSEVTVNDHELEKIGNNRWHGNIPLTETDEDTDTVKIKAKKDVEDIDEENIGNGGCPGRDSFNSHDMEYEFARINPVPLYGTQTTYYLDTFYRSGAGVIGFCVYPEPGYDPKKGLLKLEYNTTSWEIKYNLKSEKKDYFGFGRKGGNQENIRVDGTKNILLARSTFGQDSNSGKILMHILDKDECSKTNNNEDNDNNPETCFRRPGEQEQSIPEFSTFALPLAAVIGLVFIFQHRRKKEE